MKKIIFLAMVVGLYGCKEDGTGLQKNVINTGFDKCKNYLSTSLKSPSSLNVNEATILVQDPKVEDVSNVFGNIIVKDGKIGSITRDDKTRFREMLVVISYEAQNSFGVYLGGTYQCQYLFELKNDEQSPKPLNTYLIKLKSDGEDINLGMHIPITDFTGSNIKLNKKIKRVIGTSESKFTALDEKMYDEIIKQKEYKDQEIEAERIRKSWDGLDAETAATEAAIVAVDVAAEISGR